MEMMIVTELNEHRGHTIRVALNPLQVLCFRPQSNYPGSPTVICLVNGGELAATESVPELERRWAAAVERVPVPTG